MSFFKKGFDERVENVRNKIYKETLRIVLVISLVSLFFKNFIFDVEIVGVITELVILLVSGIYYLARSIFLGVHWDEVELHDRNSKMPMSKKTIFGSIGASLLIAILMGINSAVNYADSTSQGVWYFILVLLVSILIYLPILFLLFGGVYFLARKIGLKNNRE
ncbi:DUF6773 family protein [Niallia sp. XMNu-256]|uniref:DUF6773 family protein n=1 Tax=Niallia sp. XMNu-256 TaxID=3082444 RepID=UPI0030CBE7EE